MHKRSKYLIAKIVRTTFFEKSTFLWHSGWEIPPTWTLVMHRPSLNFSSVSIRAWNARRNLLSGEFQFYIHNSYIYVTFTYLFRINFFESVQKMSILSKYVLTWNNKILIKGWSLFMEIFVFVCCCLHFYFVKSCLNSVFKNNVSRRIIADYVWFLQRIVLA